MAIQTGDHIPDFELEAVTSDGVKTVRRDDFKGKKIVLYFYPKDDTPGCTKEACGFRDLTPDFEKVGAVILGVSIDSVKAHQKFIEHHALPFPLLADYQKKLSDAMGVWKEKSMYGKTFLGIERTTFLIDGDGIVRRIYPKVKVEGHVKEVLSAVSEI